MNSAKKFSSYKMNTMAALQLESFEILTGGHRAVLCGACGQVCNVYACIEGPTLCSFCRKGGW